MTQKQIAFVFPGQGSQSLGMLSSMAGEFPIVGQTFSQASEVLGYDLWKLTQEGPVQLLNQTEHTQPALLAADIAIWRVWQQLHGIKPVLVAGHSLGEYAALICAEAIEFEHAIELVAARGRYMQEAVPANVGAMAAIVGLNAEQVIFLCKQAARSQIVEPANFNGHEQTVIAGHTEAVDRAIELAKTAGAKLAKKLPVSVPSHCYLMRSAAVQLAALLQKIKIASPKLTVLHNVDVTAHSQPEAISLSLEKQLYCPVRWVETIEQLAAHPVDIIIECGPGRVLAGLNKRVKPELSTLSISEPGALRQALEELQ